MSDPVFVLGSEEHERTFFTGFPPLAQQECHSPLKRCFLTGLLVYKEAAWDNFLSPQTV